MVVSNRNLLFQRSIFRGYVSFREGKCYYLFGSFLQNEKWRPANLRKTWTCFGSTNVTTDSWLVFQHANDGPFPIKWPDLLGSPNKSSSSDPTIYLLALESLGTCYSDQIPKDQLTASPTKMLMENHHPLPTSNKLPLRWNKLTPSLRTCPLPLASSNKLSLRCLGSTLPMPQRFLIRETMCFCKIRMTYKNHQNPFGVLAKCERGLSFETLRGGHLFIQEQTRFGSV